MIISDKYRVYSVGVRVGVCVGSAVFVRVCVGVKVSLEVVVLVGVTVLVGEGV